VLLDLKNGNGLVYGFGTPDSQQYALRLLGQDSLSSSFDWKDQEAWTGMRAGREMVRAASGMGNVF
jgi:hypothetical protein